MMVTSAISADQLKAVGGGLIAFGTYTGTGSTNLAVAHGLNAAPQTVFIQDADVIHMIMNMGTYGRKLHTSSDLYVTPDGKSGHISVAVPDSTYFYVSNADVADILWKAANVSGQQYHWVAIA